MNLYLLFVILLFSQSLTLQHRLKGKRRNEDNRVHKPTHTVYNHTHTVYKPTEIVRKHTHIEHIPRETVHKPTKKVQPTKPSPMQNFVDAMMEFTGKYLYERLCKYPENSYTIVTLPLGAILGHMAFYAEGEEHRKILKMIGLKNKKEIKEVIPTALSSVNATSVASGMTFKLYGDKSEQLTDTCKKDFSEICNGETGLLNYDCPKKALQEVNQWFKTNTPYTTIPVNNTEVIKKEQKQDLLYLTSFNFLYNFNNKNNPKGFKTICFQASENESLPFPSIYGKGYVKYIDIHELDAQLIILSLVHGQFVVFFYPNDPKNLLKLLQRIQQPKVFFDYVDKAKWGCHRINITIGYADLANNLFEFVPELNLNSTSFKGVFKSGHAAHFTQAIQELHLFQAKAEKGPVDSERCPEDDIPYVEMNHPCAYYVFAANRLCIYAGILNGPQSYGL